jgi:hypothetical protein
LQLARHARPQTVHSHSGFAVFCFFLEKLSAESAMLPRPTSKNPVVLSYYEMRRAVGLIALTLPFALALGSMLAGVFGPAHHLPHPLLQRSISDYYYTPMRNYYVGSLCAIAAFLACARGYDLRDEIAGYFAGGCAFGVAFVPTFNPRLTRFTPLEFKSGVVHTVLAALMFLILAYICLFLFRKSSGEKTATRRKRDRNRIYEVCGCIMIFCIIVMVSLTAKSVIERRHPSHWLFWCEALALGAFGVAWLTKGQGFLRDKPHSDSHGVRHQAAGA